jgi:GrpB-like predicted nucleotidyltransferase (UPF0157 family)
VDVRPDQEEAAGSPRSDDRKHYEEVKRELAKRDWPDMNAYARAKTQAIEEIIAASVSAGEVSQ